MRKYLSELRPPMVALWCYFIWYLVVMGFYFEPDLKLWLTSAGISLIIGLAYNLNVLSGKNSSVPFDRWIALRFFLMPLGVSSFSGMVKGKGFFMIFPPQLHENLVGFASCLAFLFVVWLVKKTRKQVVAL